MGAGEKTHLKFLNLRKLAWAGSYSIPVEKELSKPQIFKITDRRLAVEKASRDSL